LAWVDQAVTGQVLVQASAHGMPQPAVLEALDDDAVTVRWEQPQRRVAPGQSLVFYDLDDRCVLGGGRVSR
jgi:tRNA-specific 2-thiouridylase